MRKLIIVLAVLALVSPAFAFQKVVIAAGGATSSPHVNATTVLGPVIVSGAYPGTGKTGGNLYQVGPMMLSQNQAPVSLATGWSDWAHECQASYEWAVYGGPPANVPLPIQVQNLSTGAIVSIPNATQDALKMTQVNDNGDVFWVQWGAAGDFIMHANVANPGLITQLGVATAGAGHSRLTAATSSDRVAWRLNTGVVGGLNYGSGARDIVVTDLSDGPANYTVFTSDGDQRLYHPAISDDGNWMVVNVRSTADGTQKSNLYMVDLRNIAAPVVTQLTFALDTVRNDPEMDLIDADNALVVWDEGPQGGICQIVGAYVSGLVSGNPVLHDQFLIMATPGESLREASIDNNIVAWKNYATGNIEYTIIPEPASLALFGLGVLALARRR